MKNIFSKIKTKLKKWLLMKSIQEESGKRKKKKEIVDLLIGEQNE